MKATAKKLLSLLLCMCMVMTCVGFGNVYATGEDGTPTKGHTHVYDDPTWEWNADHSAATATFACKVEGCDHEVPVEADKITSETLTTQSCTEDEVVVYTATVTFEEKEYTDVTDEITLAYATGHDYVETPIPVTCTTEGKTEFKCSVCDDVIYRDITPATGHSYGDPTWTWADDYSSATATFVCANCSDEQLLTVDSIDMTTAQAATCTENAKVTYTASVTIGDKEYADTTAEVALKDSSTGHTESAPVKENEVAPTCTKEGSCDEVVYCSVCGAELSRKTVTAEATGHAYGDPVWAWADDYSSATATFTCAVCGDVQTPDVAITANSVSEQSCTTDEVVTYTAKATLEEKEYADTTYMITLATATGHSYGDPTWVWADDYTSATATFPCTNTDCTFSQVLTVSSIDMKIVTEATCTENAIVTYTASVSINGTDYANTTTEVELADSAKGHTEGAPVKENVVAPTCTVEGGYDEVVYCSECGIELSRTTVTEAAAGHTYGAPDWKWADDYSSATATFSCEDCDDKQEVAARITLTVNKPATCTEDEEVTYTAIAEFEGKEYTYNSTQTTVKDTALGHTYNVNFSNPVPEEEKETHIIIPAGNGFGERHVFYCTRCGGAAITYELKDGQFTAQGTHSFDKSTWEEFQQPDPDHGSIGTCKAYCSTENCADCAKLLDMEYGKQIRVEQHYLGEKEEAEQAWTYVDGSATCYFNGYETAVCKRCGATAKRVKPDDSMRPEHQFEYKLENDETHQFRCTVCAEAVKDGKTTANAVSAYRSAPHRFTEWKDLNDQTCFQNGHRERECLDCKLKQTEEVANSSNFKRIITKILRASMIGAWLYYGIVVRLAKWIGVPESYLTFPTKYLDL